MRILLTFYLENLTGDRPLLRYKYRWKDNIRVNFKKLG